MTTKARLVGIIRNLKSRGMLGVLASVAFVIFVAVILLATVRGSVGAPDIYQLNELEWKDDGPLELSPERGRFALTYSLIEEGSMEFSLPVARFATPDLGYLNGKYVSMFAPGISYLIMPGYILGKAWGASQVGAYAVIAIFALLNALLVRALARLLGASKLAAALGSLTFLFATPAFAYGVSLYQHHVSTFLILFSLYMLLRFKSAWSLLVIWFLCAASIPIDYPNLFLMFPIGVAALGKIISWQEVKQKVVVSFKPLAVATFAAAILTLAFFLWFNQQSYGNPLQFSGTVTGVQGIDDQGNPIDYAKVDESFGLQQAESPFEQQERSAISFFNTRNMLHGLYTQLISADRSVLYFTPVLFLAVIGAYVLYQRNSSVTQLLLSIIAVTLVLYSMWGDPYGGWAFGLRYLIPAYSLACIFIAVGLEKWRHKSLFMLVFLLLFVYSVSVNTLGALTTNRIPPKVQVLELEELSGREEKYNYWRSYDMIQSGSSKSFVFQTYFKDQLTAAEYFYLLAGSINILGLALLLALRFKPAKAKL
jgi:hypothetical protein